MAWSAAARKAAAETRKAHASAKRVVGKVYAPKGAASLAARNTLAKAIKKQRSGKMPVQTGSFHLAVSSTKMRNAARRKG